MLTVISHANYTFFCCRKKKLYASQSLPALLEKEGVDLSPAAQTATGDLAVEQMLALETFDDTEYESRLPQEWVPKRPGAPKTPAKVSWGSTLLVRCPDCCVHGVGSSLDEAMWRCEYWVNFRFCVTNAESAIVLVVLCYFCQSCVQC